MTPREFIDKWDDAFRDAIVGVMDEVEDKGYHVEGPYLLESDGPIFGFTAWKPPIRSDDSKAVDVWWRFDPVYDEEPLRHWPALDLIEKGGSEVGSINFWDELVDLDDTKTIKSIIRGLGADVEFIVYRLNEQKWIPEWEGPKEWRPEKRRPRRT